MNRILKLNVPKVWMG